MMYNVCKLNLRQACIPVFQMKGIYVYIQFKKVGLENILRLML